MTDPAAEEIVEFWLGPAARDAETAEAQRPRWYRGGAELDAEIVARFSQPVRSAVDGGLRDWEDEPTSALGLIIALDQFTRSIFRYTPLAYAGDARGLRVANAAVDAGLDQALSLPGRLFLYHPYHHAETLAEQDRGVELLQRMGEQAPESWKAWCEMRVEGFARHRDIVARFGRFPHRNQVLGRRSTAEEITFLNESPETFGQGKR